MVVLHVLQCAEFEESSLPCLCLMLLPTPCLFLSGGLVWSPFLDFFPSIRTFDCDAFYRYARNLYHVQYMLRLEFRITFILTDLQFFSLSQAEPSYRDRNRKQNMESADPCIMRLMSLHPEVDESTLTLWMQPVQMIEGSPYYPHSRVGLVCFIDYLFLDWLFVINKHSHVLFYFGRLQFDFKQCTVLLFLIEMVHWVLFFLAIP